MKNTDLLQIVLDRVIAAQTEKKDFALVCWNRETISQQEIEQILGRKWRQGLMSVLKLITILDKADIKNPDYFELSVCDSRFVRAFGTHQTMSKVIKRAVDIDLMRVVDNHFVFNKKRSEDNESKKYAFNVALGRYIKSTWMDKFSDDVSVSDKTNSSLSLSSYLPSHYCNDSHALNINDLQSWGFRVQKGSNEFIYYPKSIIYCNDSSISYHNDSDIIYCNDSNIIYHNDSNNIITDIKAYYAAHPMLETYQAIACDINTTYYKDFPMLQQTWIPTHKGNGNIGFRATSKACNTKKDNGERQGQVFNPYFGDTKISEYDVKASIYKVTYYLNNGIWLEDSIDLYQEISPITLDKAQRKAFKALCQQVYFCTDIKNIGRNIRYHWRLYDLDQATCQKVGELIKQRMDEVIGKSYGKEIFLYESCIYCELLNRLLQKGLKVVQVYDCFYSDNLDIADLCKELLPACAQTVLPTMIQDTNNENKEQEQDFFAEIVAEITAPETTDTESTETKTETTARESATKSYCDLLMEAIDDPLCDIGETDTKSLTQTQKERLFGKYGAYGVDFTRAQYGKINKRETLMFF